MAAPTWSRWRAPSWPTLTSCASRASGGPTRSTPASPATRPVLDHAFAQKIASCLVNPSRGARAEIVLRLVRGTPKRIAVVVRWGQPGPAVIATTLAERGTPSICSTPAPTSAPVQPGQARIPGQGRVPRDFALLRRRLAVTGVRLRLDQRVDAAALQGYDDIVLATGVRRA